MNERVSTNHKPRPILTFWDLTQKEQEAILEDHDMPKLDKFGEFSLDEEPFSSFYFRYRNYVESLSDFIRITTHGRLGWTFHLPPDHPVAAQGWEAIHQDGLGMILKINEKEETVVVGWYK